MKDLTDMGSDNYSLLNVDYHKMNLVSMVQIISIFQIYLMENINNVKQLNMIMCAMYKVLQNIATSYKFLMGNIDNINCPFTQSFSMVAAVCKACKNSKKSELSIKSNTFDCNRCSNFVPINEKVNYPEIFNCKMYSCDGKKYIN